MPIDKVNWIDRERANVDDMNAVSSLTEEHFAFNNKAVVGDGLIIYTGMLVRETSTPSAQVELTGGTPDDIIAFFDGKPFRIGATQTINIVSGTPSLPANRNTAGVWETGAAITFSAPDTRIDIVLIKPTDQAEDPNVRFFIDDTVTPPEEEPQTVNTRKRTFFDIKVVHGTAGNPPTPPSTTALEAQGYTPIASIVVTDTGLIIDADITTPFSVPPFPSTSVIITPIEDILPITDNDVVTAFSGTTFLDGKLNQEETNLALDAAVAGVGGHTPNDEDVVTSFTGTTLLDGKTDQEQVNLALDAEFGTPTHTHAVTDNDVVTSFAGKKVITGLTNQEQVNLELDLVLGSLAHQSFIEGCEVRYATASTVTIQSGTIAVPNGTAVEVRNRTSAVTVDITDVTNVYDGLYNNGGGTEGAEAADTWYYVYAVVNTADAQGSTFGQGISKFAPGTDMLHPDPDAVLGTRIWRFVGTVRNDSGSAFLKFFRDGKNVMYEDELTGFSGSGGGGGSKDYVSLDLSSFVPATSTLALLTCTIGDTAGTSGHDNAIFIADGDRAAVGGADNDVGGHERCRNVSTGTQRNSDTNSFLQRLNGAQELKYRFETTNSFNLFDILVNGYFEPRETLVV